MNISAPFIKRPIGTHDFYQCWLKARASGDTSELHDFSPCNVMAEQGRFFPPSRARNTPIGGANYALHVDASLVARYLRDYSEARGLVRTEGRVVEVKRRDDGFIASVVLQSGQEIQGDFFVDCTGFRSLLILRLIPVFPFAALNYGSGFAGLRALDVVFATLLGSAPSIFIISYSADAIARGTLSGEAAFGRLLIAGLLLASLALIPMLLRKRAAAAVEVAGE